MGLSLKKIVKSVTKPVQSLVKEIPKVTQTAIDLHVGAAKALQIDKAMNVAAPVVGNMLTGGAASGVMGSVIQGSGGGMDIFGSLNGFLNQNPALQQLANNAISGLVPKSAPVAQTVAPEIRTIEVSAPSQGMSKNMIMGIGAAVVGLVLVLVLVFKKK